MAKKRLIVVVGLVFLLFGVLMVQGFVQDSDGDGVDDDDDQCPKSDPFLGGVDIFGCDCAQKIQKDCTTAHSWKDPKRTTCCGALNCHVDRSGPAKAACCDSKAAPGTALACDPQTTYRPSQVVATPVPLAKPPCHANPYLAWPNPVQATLSTALGACCSQEKVVVNQGQPIYAKNKVQFRLPCALLEITAAQSYLNPPTQTQQQKIGYALRDPFALNIQQNPFGGGFSGGQITLNTVGGTAQLDPNAGGQSAVTQRVAPSQIQTIGGTP